jgi:Rrf2 family protein
MRLTTRSRYGARLLLDIARNEAEGPVSVSEISKREDIPVKYLEALIHKLKRAGYLESVRGPRGGYRLGRSASDISLAEIVRILEGDLKLVDCEGKDTVCGRIRDCPTRRIWKDIEDTVTRKLENVSVQDLLHGCHIG